MIAVKMQWKSLGIVGIAVGVAVGIWTLSNWIKDRRRKPLNINPQATQSQIYDEQEIDDNTIEVKWVPTRVDQEDQQGPISFQQYYKIIQYFKCPITKTVMKIPYRARCCQKVFEKQYWKGYALKFKTCKYCKANINIIIKDEKDQQIFEKILKIRTLVRKMMHQAQQDKKYSLALRINKDFGYGYVTNNL